MTLGQSEMRVNRSGILVLSPAQSIIDRLDTLLMGVTGQKVTQYQEAMDAVAACYATVLVDMAIADSLILISQLREKDNGIEVIAFSNTYDSDMHIQALKAGARYVFAYPIQDLDKVKAAIGNHYDRQYDANSVQDMAYGVFQSALKEQPSLMDIDTQLAWAKYYIRHQSDAGEPINPDVFWALFPLKDRISDSLKRIRSEIGESAFELMSRHYPTVLVVEDEDSFRLWIKSVLRRITPNILEADSAETALTVIQSAKSLDVKCLDIALPGKSGIELISDVDALFPDSKTIMLTAFDQTSYIEDSFKHRISDYLVKSKNSHHSLVEKLSDALMRKGFSALMPVIGSELLSRSLSFQMKCNVLMDIYKRKWYDGVEMEMSELYLFFPELAASGIPPTQRIPEIIYTDGLGTLVGVIEYVIVRKKDWRGIFDDWEGFIGSEE